MTRFDKWITVLFFAILLYFLQNWYCKSLENRKYDWPVIVYTPILAQGESPNLFTKYEYYMIVDGKRHDLKRIVRTIEYNGDIFTEQEGG